MLLRIRVDVTAPNLKSKADQAFCDSRAHHSKSEQSDLGFGVWLLQFAISLIPCAEPPIVPQFLMSVRDAPHALHCATPDSTPEYQMARWYGAWGRNSVTTHWLLTVARAALSEYQLLPILSRPHVLTSVIVSR